MSQSQGESIGKDTRAPRIDGYLGYRLDQAQDVGHWGSCKQPCLLHGTLAPSVLLHPAWFLLVSLHPLEIWRQGSKSVLCSKEP